VSATGVSLDLARQLRAICGDEHVVETAAGQKASFTVSPTSSDDVASVVRLANQRGFTIAPVGIPRELVASYAQADVLLRTDCLTDVEHYDPADLTVGIGAGMTMARLNAMVGEHRLMLACDPPFPEYTTVGELLAAAQQGPLRHGYGAVRDFCIGIRFVTGDGRKAKGGGRVVKNVAGYDLMKLLIGSYGTLAVITSASFKLFPTPRQTRTFLAEFSTWQEALKFRDLVVHSPLSPMCLEIVSPTARRLMRPEMQDDAWVICLRGAGSDAVLARYRKELGSAVTREVDGANEAELWRALENFPGAGPDLWLSAAIDVPIGEGGKVLQILQGIEDGDGVNLIGRAAVGHLILALPNSPTASSYVEKIIESLVNANVRDCSVSVHGPGKLCRMTPTDSAGMRAVKRALDPNNVLRGREL
jgi:glycolate dehydrogenase FAD-binding subunit